MTGRLIFEKFNNIIQGLSYIYRIFPTSFRIWLFHHSNALPGHIGYLQRYLLAKTLFQACGKNVRIEPYVIIKDMNHLSVGDNVSINAFTYLIASGGISIGNNVSIAHSSSIVAETHNWSDSNKAICYNEITPTPVVIEDDVWIGCGVRIIGPCTIKKRVIVAAGTVVKGKLHENTIWGGVIGHVIKNV